jgi:hypothetical protein
MSAKTFRTVGRRTQAAAALAGLVALFAGVAFLSGPGNQAGAADGAVSADGAVAASGKAVYLGRPSAKRIPLCPQRCSAVAIVSGIQAKAGGKPNAYRVPFVGKITRWRIKLGDPGPKQVAYFKSHFGAEPQAAIGILSKREAGGKIVYKLRRRTQMKNLTAFFGRTATFNLPRPVNVNKGDFVSLIVPTWAPALSTPPACQVTNGVMRNEGVCNTFNLNNSWVASRTRKQCFNSDGSLKRINMRTSQAQVKVNTLQTYGCRFNGALTYGVRVESR